MHVAFLAMTVHAMTVPKVCLHLALMLAVGTRDLGYVGVIGLIPRLDTLDGFVAYRKSYQRVAGGLSLSYLRVVREL